MRPVLLAALLGLAAAPAAAQLRLPRVLADGAVLQRDRPIPVWGHAAPGASVAVRLGDALAAAVADADGRWSATLPARAAGGPHTLSVVSGAERVDVRDVLVGEVWVASGQSNMEWAVRDSDGAEATIAGARDAQIREFKVPHTASETPRDTLAGGAWAAASPETVGGFSAVAYAFARELRRTLGVPVGILNASWGGSRIEPWMSPAMLGYAPDELDEALGAERRRAEALRADLEARLGRLPEAADPDDHAWADPALDDGGWARITAPGRWEDQGYDGLDGVAWYRRTVELSAKDAEAGVTLGLGMIDDDDVSFVNGVEVGRVDDGWNVPRRYAVPPAALRPGTNTVAVRVTDHTLGGGIGGPEAELYVETADGARRSLADGAWRFRVAAARQSAERPNHVPTLLWNAMLRPLTEQPVAGVIWYQGESNAGSPGDAAAYAGLFTSMIEGWRAAWDDDALPFLWVQLAAFMDPPADADDTGTWPALRASQSAALALDRTAEVVTLDVGAADDIHPRDKATVGRRLARAARAVAYGEAELRHAGPRVAEARREGRAARVVFAGGPLASRDGAAPGGFALRGADGAWHGADARLDRDAVVVSAPAVEAPTEVRYAWANNPDRATLIGEARLPAAPFWVTLDAPEPAAADPTPIPPEPRPTAPRPSRRVGW